MLTDGRTDGRTTDARVTGILIAHLGAFGSGELKILQVIIWPRCASRSYWHWGSHIGLRALAGGPIWLSSANMT